MEFFKDINIFFISYNLTTILFFLLGFFDSAFFVTLIGVFIIDILLFFINLFIGNLDKFFS